MDTIDWRILHEIEKGNSITAIGNALFVSQPAVSYRLSKIEKEYGVQLFIRNNRGIFLTDAGRRLCRFANQMISMEEEIRMSVMSTEDNLRGAINIGSVASFAGSGLADQVKAFHDIYPDVLIGITVDHTPNLITSLKEKKLPCIIIRGRNVDGWDGGVIEISSEMAVVVANEPITDEYIKHNPCIRTGFDGFRTQLDMIADEWMLQKTGQMPFSSNVIIGGGSQSAIQLVKRGIGWAVVTSSKLLESDGLYNKVLYNAEGAPFFYKTFLLYEKDIEQFDVYSVFLKHFRNFFSL